MKFSAVFSITLLFCGQAAAQGTAACDRECLNGFVDQYLDALVKHDPKLVPLTKNVKFTENGQRLDPGDGLEIDGREGHLPALCDRYADRRSDVPRNHQRR